MQVDTINQANKRLRQAKNALALLENAKKFQAIDDAWSAFIMAFSGCYEKLRAGSLGNPRTNQWFWRKVHERKSDPLLNYVFQARNADYHGLACVTLPINEQKVALSGTGRPYRLGNGKLALITVQSTKLDTIKNKRAGITLHPPTHYLGERLLDQQPATVARLAVSYLETLVAEAETFA